MLTILRQAWATVESSYRAEQINSERCLQAVLYHALRTSSLPKTDTILVEPGLDDLIPDIVVRDEHAVKCILELKCTPHYFVGSSRLRQDLEKLICYSSKQGSKVRLDVFGPDRVFNVKTETWSPSQPEFSITPETWHVFAVLTRSDDGAAASLEGRADRQRVDAQVRVTSLASDGEEIHAPMAVRPPARRSALVDLSSQPREGNRGVRLSSWRSR